MTAPKRILIVGGVAGGASAAARARRLDETAEIILFDRGPFVSFANCGLPYYVGNVITEEKKLIVASAELFKSRFNIEVRPENDVLTVDRAASEIEVRELKTGRTYRERYDALVLSPGASPIRPPLPGIDLPGVFALRTIPDSRKIRDWITAKKAQRAVVVGAGFIGLEMAENLAARGLKVTVVEMADQVLPPLDPELAVYVADRLTANGVTLRLGDGLAGFEPAEGGSLIVKTMSGAAVPADLAILGLGVRPETALAKAAGLEIGARGGIRTDDRMRTADPKIWAVGDAVEVRDVITGEWIVIPLAGPANRQGRVAADDICGRESRFRGVQATAVCGVFGATVAMTGASEKSLRRAGMDYRKIYLHPGHHVGYFPGAKPIHMKLLFSPAGGRVLGAQAVGEEGVDKRIDVVAAMIQKGGTVFDLEEAELCYAPQFGAAKDPINIAGMIGANHLRGDLPLAAWETLPADQAAGAVVLDVREPAEFAAGHIPGALSIPLADLRRRVGELPADRPILLCCGVGQRSYYATRLLLQNGLDVRNLSGGWQTFQAFRAAERKG